jgi:recombinational DNA repair protein RecT
LIPFKNTKRNTYECQLIIDYKGYVQLVFRSGMIQSIHADVIYEGDDFAYDRGVVQRHTKWEWRPASERPKMRGNLLGAYASVRIIGGAEAHVALSKDEVDAIRRRSKSANNGPWVTDYNAMACKSAFKRLVKWLPISTEIRKALEVDDEEDTPNLRSQNAIILGDIVTGESLVDDENTIDATAEDVTPAWQRDLDEVRILVGSAAKPDDILDIEQVWLERHSDAQWRAEFAELLSARMAQLEGK